VAGDAEPAFELVHAREPILRWLVWNGPERVEELRVTYARWLAPADGQGEGRGDFHFAIVERESERLVGSIGVRFSGHSEIGDVGYWVGEPFWGRGYGTEAVALASHVAFELLGAQALSAWVFVGNEASRIVLERSGYSLVRTVRGRLRPGPGQHDEWYFTLLRSEWERAPDRPRPRIEVEPERE